LRAAVVLLLLCFVTFCSAEPRPALNLMPVPASVQTGAGHLLIDTSFSAGIAGPKDPLVQRVVEVFLANLRRQTGMSPLDMQVTDSTKATLVIRADHPNQLVQELGEDESYSLEISPAGAKLNAATPLGIMRGLQTVLQLLETTSDGFAVPAVTIRDQPRFPWRGLMIDVSRHFMPTDVLKRNLDGMAALKLNVFHWHLSDDQGFRLQSKKFPKLQEMGSDGLYYTQEQVREVIAYARERGIRVVPEFDMPGHSTAWFVGYTELASAPGPYQIERKWGVFDATMDPTEERTYKFLDVFIGEMAELFPDKYFHIGGDEVNGKQWDANSKIQAFLRAHGLKNNQDLQAYFNQRVQKIVSKHGKIMIGWDEVLYPSLPNDLVVQSWRGQDSLAQAVQQGYRGILSFGYYLDPMSDAPANLTSEDAQRILGGEACMWAEYVSSENVDSRIWPRMAAIAERLWSPQNVTDINSMYERLEATSHWLDWLGLTHNSSYELMLRRIAGTDDISALKPLADVVEPVNNDVREETAPVEPTSLVPLDRLIDAVRPESSVARQFANSVDRFVASRRKDKDNERLIKVFLLTRNSSFVHYHSSLLREAEPLANNLSRVATVGLQALDYLDRGERPSDAWVMRQTSLLQEAQKPQAQLLLMIVDPVQRLVQAAADQKGPAAQEQE